MALLIDLALFPARDGALWRCLNCPVIACPPPRVQLRTHNLLADKGAKKRSAAESAAEGSGNIAKMFRTAAARPHAAPKPSTAAGEGVGG